MITIGTKRYRTNIFMAPMSGCTDLSCRLVAREAGAELCFLEMIDANSLTHGHQGSPEIVASCSQDQPLAAQLVGADPETMLLAAERLLTMVRADFLDINAACPVRKVVGKGGGASLLREPKKLSAMIKLLSRELNLPITVKLRLGFDTGDIKKFTALAKLCEQSGAAALFIHGRTRAQGYSGQVDYEAIRLAKEAVRIPVIGSGDIFSPELASKMLKLTGCDGVLVARGGLGAPWLFQEIKHYLQTGALLPPVTLRRRTTILLRHLKYLECYKQGSKIGWMRKVAIWYLQGFPHAAKVRGLATQAQNYQEIVKLVSACRKPGCF